MKKRTIIILSIIIIALLIGGGIMVWKWKSSKRTNFDNSPTKTPLNQLSEQELEKCLLEDFSRRLELEKYFVFNLGELTTEKIRGGNDTIANGRITNQSLQKDLTKLANSHGFKEKKNAVILVDKDGKFDKEYADNKLNEKINEGKIYIFFEKNQDADYTGKIGVYESSSIVWIKLKPTCIFRNKSEALVFLKTDPALQGKI